MQRKHLPYLTEWFHRDTRKPLILRGARQVGKTTLVRLLAQTLNVQLIELNMEDVHAFVPLLEQNDPIKVFEVIALSQGIDALNPENSLIFFDEAQEAPKLIAFLRYCYERAPEYRVVVAGSLLEFVLDDYEYSFPVGRIEFMYVGPMTFEEYLPAVGQKPLLKQLENFTLNSGLAQPIQQLLEQQLRNYFISGGMPAVVDIQSKQGSLLDMERVKTGIIEAYYSDFSKYHKRIDTELLQQLFQKTPLLIGNKLSPAKLVSDRKARDIWRHLDFLELALLLRRSTHTNAAELPLAAGKVDKIIKMIFLDVGLVQSLLGVTIPAIETTQDINTLAKGAIAEQFVGQHLMYERPLFEKPTLYHWDRPIRGSEAEVDYVAVLDDKVIPIEVKSGTGGAMKALRLMLIEKKLSIALRFYNGEPRVDDYRIKTPDGEWPYRLLSLPHYLIQQWPRLLRELL